MKIITQQIEGLPQVALNRFCAITRLARISAGALFLALIHSPGVAFSQTLPGLYNVSLAWDGSSSPELSGYRVHYGTTRGSYTDSIIVGNVTTATIPGLANGITYFLVVTALNSSGVESLFSNEVSYLPGLQTVSIAGTAKGGADLIIHGLIGHRYDIEATQDFRTWTIINTVTVGDGGALAFTDPNAASFPKRFYRTHAIP